MAVTALVEQAGAVGQAAVTTPPISVRATSRLADVAETWQALEAAGIESPGQSLAVVRDWLDTQHIPESRQLYLVAEQRGAPLALLALRVDRRWGMEVGTWILGRHVGCNGPVTDPRRLASLGEVGRRALWDGFAQAARGAGVDLLHLPAMLADIAGQGDLYAGFGRTMAGDTLYRAEFASWTEADSTQRNKSRRKHDRQQGDRLDAMGSVGFAEIDGRDPDAGRLLALMFAQRAARFVQMGVADPFASEAVRDFYATALRNGVATGAFLNVLTLDGEPVAFRYNIRRGTRIFCLISSMSTEAGLQPGSPGKQILLRLMQTMFDAGTRSFDMGAGLTDEKRHWCNVQIALRDHVVPLTAKGRLAAGAVSAATAVRARVKSDPRLLGLAKRVRALLHRAPAPSGGE